MSTSNKKINQFNAEGLRDGWWEHHYNNGQLAAKGNYINGIRDGWWEGWWYNGKMAYMGNVTNGNKFGFWKNYNQSECLTHIDFYVNI